MMASEIETLIRYALEENPDRLQHPKQDGLVRLRVVKGSELEHHLRNQHLRAKERLIPLNDMAAKPTEVIRIEGLNCILSLIEPRNEGSDVVYAFRCSTSSLNEAE